MADHLTQSVDGELTSHFECPVCFHFVFPPIQQCRRGHLICFSCHRKLNINTCPVCRCLLEDVPIRNLALEKIASDITFPCKYASNGCTINMKWMDKWRHEEVCDHQCPQCPIPGDCGFQGSLVEITDHLKTKHGLVANVGENFEWVIGANDLVSIEGDTEFYMKLMSCHGQQFLAILRKTDIGVMFYEYQYQGVVQTIGFSATADVFKYRMKIDRGRRKSNWEGATLSITEKIATAFNTGDCFYIHPNTGVLLGHTKKGLCITVTISKVEAAETVEAEEMEGLNEKGGTGTPQEQKSNCRYCPRTKKMRCCLGLGIFIAVVGVAVACLFRNPTLFMYPIHASCNITWTFQDQCDGVANRLIKQMEVWTTNATCGTGQKCLYTFGTYEGNILKAIHTTPKAGYIDDLDFKFFPNTGSGGCNVVGYSTSRIFFAVLDFGTNYCNLHNLMDGAGLMSDANYSELTRDEICTQYTSANCEKY